MTIDEYLAGMSPAQRAEYARIRQLVQDTVPEVQEGISYKMPVFTLHGKNLLWVGAFKRHMSLFPGTVKFTPEAPLPATTIIAFVRQRLTELNQPKPTPAGRTA